MSFITENPGGDIEFIDQIRLVSSAEALTEEERKSIIETADNFLSHVSARRFCDMTEEFFLDGEVEENQYFYAPMEAEDFYLFEEMITAYRTACTVQFGKEIIPQNDILDELGVSEENMIIDPYNYGGYNMHIFLRAITKTRKEEILEGVAENKDLVRKVKTKMQTAMEKEESEPEAKLPGTDAGILEAYLDNTERRFMYSLPGMRMGDEAPVSLAIEIQSAIFRKKLAEERNIPVPIGAFLTREEIQSAARKKTEKKQKSKTI